MKNLVFLFLLITPFLTKAQATEGTLLGTWSNPDLIGSSAFDNAYNEIWGHAADDREYAIIGTTAGTHFIEVTDPSTPTEVAFVEGGQTGSVVIHRDYHNLGNYLYAVCDEGNQSTLQIIDLSNLPNEVTVVYDSNELFYRAHNIFIDESTERLYVLSVGSPNDFSPMKIYDISDPVAPSLLASHNSFEGNTVGHVHDAYVKDNLAYLNCGTDGLYIVDFSDVNNPVLLGSMVDYLQSGYNHSGWPSEDGQYYYFSDEDHGKDVKAVAISDFSDMQITSFFDAGLLAAASSIPHNQVVHDNYLYVSYYYDGLQVYDLSDPSTPAREMYYDTSTEPAGFNYKGAWGVYPFLPSGNILVSDMQEGLFVLETLEEETSSIEKIIDNTLVDVFPQPASDQLTVRIQLENNVADGRLEILDYMGKTVYSNAVDLTNGQKDFLIEEINILSSGYYILRVQGTKLALTKPFIIGR